MSTQSTIKIGPSDLESFDECPNCCSSEIVDRGDVAGGRTYDWCLICGLNFMNPRPTRLFLSRFYSSEYWKLTNSEVGVVSRIIGQLERSAVFLRILSKLKLPSFEGKILEIGSGTGGVVWSMANALGLSPHANEPDAEAKKFLELLDIVAVLNEDIDSGELDGSYSVVVLSHVLEHQTHPRQFLERAIRLLTPGGVMVIEVPNGSVVGPDGGIEHPVVFSRHSLSYLLDQFGFSYQIKMHAGRGRAARPPQYLVGVVQKVPGRSLPFWTRPSLSIRLSRAGRLLSPWMRSSVLFSAVEKLLGRRVRTSDEKTVTRLRLSLIEKLFAKLTATG